VLSLVTDPVDAEDIVQETFAKYTARGRVPNNPAGYLFRMARNEAWSLLRRRRLFFWTRRRLGEQAALLGAATEERPPCEREVIETALRRLPVTQREVVVLKHFEGMTFQEIGQVVDCSPNTAASRYRYAIEKLRASLDQEDFMT
jgi:RNA polymerase sigma-70 factor (ECF subfamily)